MGKSEYREKGFKQLCRTKNPHMTLTQGPEPEWHWWELSALTTAPSPPPPPSLTTLCNKGTRSNKGGAHTSLIEGFFIETSYTSYLRHASNSLLSPCTGLELIMDQDIACVDVLTTAIWVMESKRCTARFNIVRLFLCRTQVTLHLFDFTIFRHSLPESFRFEDEVRALP